MMKIDTLETAESGPDDPLPLFQAWLTDAEASELNDPNAMSLATIDADGTPSVRIVLLKALDERGFVFYTNRDSRKGRALAANAKAALCFHWKSLQRQVRIEGSVAPIDDAESDAYYASRGRGSRVGAWASLQSQDLPERAVLQERVATFDKKFGTTETIPRPPHWGGYRLVPRLFEFWSEGESRLHTRLIYTREGGAWRKKLLYP